MKLWVFTSGYFQLQLYYLVIAIPGIWYGSVMISYKWRNSTWGYSNYLRVPTPNRWMNLILLIKVTTHTSNWFPHISQTLFTLSRMHPSPPENYQHQTTFSKASLRVVYPPPINIMSEVKQNLMSCLGLC